MLHNVPAVCDGFAVAIEERGAFQQPQTVVEQNTTKGASPTGVLRNPSRPTGGDAHTDLLCAVGFALYTLNIIYYTF